jgi:hypothetical protein
MTLAQLAPQTRTSPTLPKFTANGSTAFYFQPGAMGLSSSAEGCNQQEGAPKGGLSKTRAAGACQAGAMGYAVNYGAGDPAVYTSAPLTAPVTVGGPMTFTVYLADPAETVWQAGFAPQLSVEVNAVDANGELIRAVASGEFDICDAAGNCKTGPTPVRGVYTLNIPGVTLPAGSRLSVVMRESAAVASATHTVYGGKGTSTSYSDAGVKLTTGTLR